MYTSFEALPLEIQELVFEHACCDGGKSGCTLALVSRDIAAKARPWRYHSVVLIGGRSILSFAALAKEKLQKREAFDVRCLYVADYETLVPGRRNDPLHSANFLQALREHTSANIPQELDPVWYHSRYNFARPRTMSPTLRQRLASWLPTTEMIDPQALAQAQVRGLTLALLDIFNACTSKLQALYLNLITEPVFLPYYLPIRMPALVDLTVAILPVERLQVSVLTPEDGAHFAKMLPPFTGGPPAPSLQRLHVFNALHASVFSRRRRDTFYDCLHAVAPNADQLRLTTWAEPDRPTQIPDEMEYLEVQCIRPYNDWIPTVTNRHYYDVFWQRSSKSSTTEPLGSKSHFSFREDPPKEVHGKPLDGIAQWLDRVAWRKCWTEHDTPIPLSFTIS